MKDINYSNDILHKRQTSTDCWARSSQMLISWTLNRLGLSNKEIELIYSNHLIPDRFMTSIDTHARVALIKELNERLRGFRIHEQWEMGFSLNEIVWKIYIDHGGGPRDPVYFAAVLANYLAVLTRIDPSFDITIYLDDPDPNPTFLKGIDAIKLRDLREILGENIYSGKWNLLSLSFRKEYLLEMLKHSPVVLRTSGHAFLLSGYFPEQRKFMINDSMAGQRYLVHDDDLLRHIESPCFFVEIRKGFGGILLDGMLSQTIM